jgi:hypothetical protein
VVRRAVNWCEQMLAFPRLAMTTTRSMVRSDLVRLFDDPGNLNVEKFVDVWYSESSQAALRNLVRRLQKK